MRCEIFAVGKLKEKYLKDGIAEYLKRLQPVFPVSVREFADRPIPEQASEKEVAAAVAKESEAMLAAIKPEDLVVALAIDGKMLSSEELAQQMNSWTASGRQRLIFVIGGSCGISPELLRRADFKLSFGKATFPHQLMRLVLSEQIYRSVKINRREPYHK